MNFRAFDENAIAPEAAVRGRAPQAKHEGDVAQLGELVRAYSADAVTDELARVVAAHD